MQELIPYVLNLVLHIYLRYWLPRLLLYIMYMQLIACLCRLEWQMRKQGNQKHLTFEQRVDIEKGLTENKSFAEIAKLIGKDPSTVSKEVRRHSHEKERPDAGYTNPPCTNRKGCKMICLCEEQCGTLCKVCNRPSKRCIDFCPQYETPTCENFGNRLMCAMDVEKGTLSYAEEILFLKVCSRWISQSSCGMQSWYQSNTWKHSDNEWSAGSAG